MCWTTSPRSARQHAGNEALGEFVGPLAVHAKAWSDLTQELGKRAAGQSRRDRRRGDRLPVLLRLHRAGLAVGTQRGGAAATASLGEAASQAKRDTARFYFQRILPRTHAHLAAMRSGLAGLPARATDPGTAVPH